MESLRGYATVGNNSGDKIRSLIASKFLLLRERLTLPLYFRNQGKDLNYTIAYLRPNMRTAPFHSLGNRHFRMSELAIFIYGAN